MAFTFSRSISHSRCFRLGLQRAGMNAVRIAQREGQASGYIGFTFGGGLYTIDIDDSWNGGRYCLDSNACLICED